MRKTSIVLGLLSLTLPVVATASPASVRKAADASVDRNYLAPTAETISPGQVTFNSYELFFAGLTYGVSDNLQLSATTLLPIVSDMPFLAVLSAKQRLVANDKLIFSVQPSVTVANASGATAGLVGAQFLLDLILDEAGDYVLSFGENNQFAFGAFEGDVDFLSEGFLVTLTAGFNARVGRIVKLIAEFWVPGAVVFDGGSELVQEGLLLNYGVRFFGESIAVDLGFIRPVHPDVESGLALGLPLVTFAARF